MSRSVPVGTDPKLSCLSRLQERIASDIAKYNRLFGGVPVSFVQRLRDAPLLLRRMVGELLDPGRSLALLHNIRILFCVSARKSQNAWFGKGAPASCAIALKRLV